MQQELETLISLSNKEHVTEDEKGAILFLISELLSDEKAVKKKTNYTDDDIKAAEWMAARVNKILGREKKHPIDSWANTIRLMREIDKLSIQEITSTFDWANKDSFWHKNILSPDKLRRQYDKLRLQMNDTAPQAGNELSPSEEFRQHLIGQGKRVDF